jgi:hypothetical protein
MRSFSLSVTILLGLLSTVALAQQSAVPPVGETIGHPPPLPAPPPIPEPSSTAVPAPAASAPTEKEPAPNGHTGAYAPAATYSKDTLPEVNTGPGLNKVAPDGSTKTVRAVPCSTAAHETDGFTTCVGIPDQSQRRHRGQRESR